MLCSVQPYTVVARAILSTHYGTSTPLDDNEKLELPWDAIDYTRPTFISIRLVVQP